MTALNYKDYFLQPVDGSHRRYEALRCVVVEEQSMKQVAQRFEVSYGTLRNWVSEFCRLQDAGESPPFSLQPCADVLSLRILVMKIRKSKLLMFERCRWKQVGD
jgi:transposase-like protein